MKTIADQLREQLAKPVVQTNKTGQSIKTKKSGKETIPPAPAIMEAIYAFDTTGNKHMVHARFDSKTVDLLNKFKMASGVDVSKTVAFAVHHLLATYPEIKSTIKQYIQNTDL